MSVPRIDCHQHFWHYEPSLFAWIDEPMAVIRRDLLPSDLAPELQRASIDGCIAVQAPQSLAETRFLLSCAHQNSFVRGVVGYVDLRSKELGEQLREFTKDPHFIGVRHIAQAEPDPRFLVQPDMLRGIALLQSFDLAYDLLVYKNQLPAAIELCARFTGQRFVLDHLAKPGIARNEWQPWADQIAMLAALPNVAAKLSGMVTEADFRTWSPAQLKPYVDHALCHFGPERLMFGSDWPVCLVASSYQRWVETLASLLAHLSAAQREQIFGGNAQRWYRLPAKSSPR
ncbi:MAG: amidohydrolase family protein [Planctomycetota bacterium]